MELHQIFVEHVVQKGLRVHLLLVDNGVGLIDGLYIDLMPFDFNNSN